MEGNMPITSAVYGRRSTRRKPVKNKPRRVAVTLVRDRIDPAVRAELERRFPLTKGRKRSGRR